MSTSNHNDIEPDETNEVADTDTTETADTTGATEADVMRNGNLDNIVLALLFSSDEPLSVRKMAAIVEDATAEEIKASIEQWRERIESESWSIRIEHVAGGYRFASHPDYASYVARLYSGRRKLRLSRAGLETIAIIAYKQPVTRAEIEVIRGVGCGGVIANLMERSLIKIVGKAKVLGAPFLYGTTPEFLEYLGLNSLGDLPSLEELEALLEKEASENMTGVAHDELPPESDEESDESDEVDVDARTVVAEALSNLEGVAAAARSASTAPEFETSPGLRKSENKEDDEGIDPNETNGESPVGAAPDETDDAATEKETT